MRTLPIITKLHEHVGTGHFYDDGYACFGGGRYESRPATEAMRPANRDGSEAAAIIEKLYEALDAAVNGDPSVWLIRAKFALAKANGEQVHSDPLPKQVGR